MLMEKPDRLATCCASLDFLPGQNITSIGSSDTDETALAVMASTSPPAWATTTATPVANSPMVLRNWRPSGGECGRGSPGTPWSWVRRVTGLSSRPEGFVPALLHEGAHFLGILLDVRAVARDECARHTDRISEKETLIQHLAAGEG